ncbi:MAG: LPS export ABC transporter permease LptF [Nitrospiraceae bacterium]|nr:LPS export ABC transporter permease LptF [Nitrospiraceae bacterium]
MLPKFIEKLHKKGPMSLLSKMILKEITPPFLFSFFALSIFLLLASMLHLTGSLVKTGIRPIELLKFIILLLPTFWSLVLPMATLLGVLLGFLSLSRDSEIIALFACGTGPKRLIVPVIVVSVISWLLSLFISVYVIPRAKTAYRDLFRELVEHRLARGIPEKIFFSPLPGLTVYVNKSLDQGHRLEGIYIRDARRHKVANQILAKKGKLLAQPGGGEVVLKLRQGVLSHVSDNYRESDTIDFDSYSLFLSLTANNREPSRGELAMKELLKVASDPNTPPRVKYHYLTEFHKRLAIPLGALILGIMAAPLGIFFGRAGLSGGIALGLAAFMAYYLSILFGENMADTGMISPGIALWIPDFIFSGIAAGLIWLLNKRGPLKA